ncbi:MAG TPA: hypothetical protein VFQ55_15085, partial [Casimicrobiaceae bacterium]|nr:hypothetical protein [Casimicrobiaceae bacterium]
MPANPRRDAAIAGRTRLQVTLAWTVFNPRPRPRREREQEREQRDVRPREACRHAVAVGGRWPYRTSGASRKEDTTVRSDERASPDGVGKKTSQRRADWRLECALPQRPPR